MMQRAVEVAYGLIALATLLVVILSARVSGQAGLLEQMTRENGPAEWGSFCALCLLAGVAFHAFRRRAPAQEGFPWLRLLLGGLSLLALLAALEEISWGQQIFGFGSGEFFTEHNAQKETNLHNLLPLQPLPTASPPSPKEHLHLCRLRGFDY